MPALKKVYARFSGLTKVFGQKVKRLTFVNRADKKSIGASAHARIDFLSKVCRTFDFLSIAKVQCESPRSTNNEIFTKKHLAKDAANGEISVSLGRLHLKRTWQR
jgi:hypothetical protein